MPELHRPDHDMRRALGAKLRKAFAPVAGSGSTIDAEIAALCRRIGDVGGDRQGRPFPDDDRRR